jgi:diguanylate cyclase (GGDEF)-like protein/PAS domain S-box-containing protein
MTTPFDFRILIIDDNVEIHHDFIKVLTNTDSHELEDLKHEIFGTNNSHNTELPYFEIDIASQGQEGVHKIIEAIKQKKPYALAFVDIRMPPGWDGVETIKHIWEIDKDIQVVICTAYSDYSWEETISHLGKTDNLLILKKPYDFIAVRQLACALTKKWQLLQESVHYTSSLEQRVKEHTETLQQSLSRLRATLESSTDGILVIDQNNKVVDFNQKFLTLWAISEEELTQKDFLKLLDYFNNYLAETNELNDLRELILNKEKITLGLLKLNDHRIFEYYSQPQKLETETIGRVFSFRDISQRAKLEKELQHQATHDALTGLPNRVLLEDFLIKIIAESQRKNTHFAVLFFDLDRFKLINDSLSHAVGDELLRLVANRLRSTLRSCDLVARLGGDEFVVVLDNLRNNPKNIIQRMATKLLDAMHTPFHIEKREIVISTSIGISIYPNDGQSSDILLRSADTAMYQAKSLGANQYQFYTEKLHLDNLYFLETEMQLRNAIINDELILYYQPQIDVNTNKLVAVEALIRWNHPTKGLLLPIDFIPLAEETGLIVPIGDWVLRTACKQNKEWQLAGLPPVRVAVNITTQQLNQLNLVEHIQDILTNVGLKPEFLELELTENSIISNTNVIEMINALKDSGIRIALDDFGTGYSSLSYLKNIHLDRLKIDRSFVQNILMNKGDDVIIQAIITMAKSLNLEVLAEGVETEQQLDFLKKQNCGEVQGFYFSKPLSTLQFQDLLTGDPNMEHLIEKNAKSALTK